MRIADMETDKARNMVEYEEDIKSRPKKSWFQTNQEKREVREPKPFFELDSFFGRTWCGK